MVSVPKEFLHAREGLNIRLLYCELDDATVQEAQSRKVWWIGLLAELAAENVGCPATKLHACQARPNKS